MRNLTQSERKRHRQEEILLSLDVMKFATREQIQQKHNLGTDRNALKVLNEMKDYLQVKVHEGRNIYYLNAKARELVGVEQEVKWTVQVDHHLMRNDIYLYYYCPKDWHIEESIKFTVNLKDHVLVPDANFTIEGKRFFVEVDRTQSMSDNKKKIEMYSILYPAFERIYGHTPTLVFYTTTELRKQKLREYCKEQGVNARVVTKEDLR